MNKRTVVLGASNKQERYSYKALRMLREHGHDVIPIHPIQKEIEGVRVTASLRDVEGDVDTVTVYLSPETSVALADDIIRINPHRVILNPGAESPELEEKLRAACVPFEHACTLVLLASGQY